MTEERTAGVGLDIPDGAKVANCHDCGELVFVIKMTDGAEILCQPVVVRGLIPDRELVQLRSPSAPEDLIQKLVSRTATARFSPPIMVPHHLVCIRAPLIRTLPVPVKVVPQGPVPPAKPAPETDKVDEVSGFNYAQAGDDKESN
jgi:hypothetical protein